MTEEEYRQEWLQGLHSSDYNNCRFAKNKTQFAIDWIKERFPDGKYQDIIGLCKVAKIDEEDGIKEQDYSLNAGRYVGVVIEDDGMTENEFKDTILRYNNELLVLNEDVKQIENNITNNFKGLFK